MRCVARPDSWVGCEDGSRVRGCSHSARVRRSAGHTPRSGCRCRDRHHRVARGDGLLGRRDRRSPHTAGHGRRWDALVAGHDRPPPAALGHAAPGRATYAPDAAARLLPGGAGRRGADARAATAGRPRLLHRRLQPRAEPDADDPRGRPRPALLDGLDRRDAVDEGRDDRRLPRRDRRVHRRDRRRAGQPRRRLPGRLAGDDLRRAAPRAGQHAHDRGRPDRLPCRRRGDSRVGAGAVRRATCASTRTWSRSATAS